MKLLKVGRDQIIGGLQGKIFKRYDMIRITCAEKAKELILIKHVLVLG